ncbi:UDP:flavonoid glycosyltransferase YjiC (YdhE family) [Kutzneria viridogrisea]|uniref:UDP:flavonoid glycosyltransferase YjiC (YdhE family) n=1 Tax=Kutzneria viridogrisea TaxID=47990 RepID=A0ABR6BAH1_9PSEU|nr:UDP:flavonoid glycosyltransferase YjiC (YdhE family) [Kutzneria viridogrisea]
MFTVSDITAHYFPMVPLGWAVQAAGHELRVVCAPGQSERITGAGLTPVPVLTDIDIFLLTRFYFLWQTLDGNVPAGTWLPPMDPETGAELDRIEDYDFSALAQRMLASEPPKTEQRIDAMVDFARSWRPDLIVHDSLQLDAVVAARVTGVPAVMHLTGPTGTAETEWGAQIVPSQFSPAYQRHGIADPGAGLIEHVIDLCPPSMAPPTDAVRHPLRPVPYNGSGGLPAELLTWSRSRRRPRIAIVWSSTMVKLHGWTAFPVRMLALAAAKLDVDVVVTVDAQSRARLGTLPDSVRVLEQCPLNMLLEHCEVVVHHGGHGSTMTAVAAGVPQLMVTYSPEHTICAKRLVPTGAARWLYGPYCQQEDVTAALAALLTETVHRDSARQLRAEAMAQPSPVELVTELADLAATPVS